MAENINYEQVLSNLNKGYSNQNFTNYAAGSGLAVNYNPELNRMTINNIPVDLAKSGLQLQDGQLVGTEASYKRLMQPFIEESGQGLLSLQPYTTPDYLKQFISDVVKQQLAPYNYDINEDPAAIAARKQLEQSMAEMAGKRGFLYGGTQQAIVDRQFENVAPAFEEMAYQQNQDFLNRQLQLVNVVMQWDQLQANNVKNEQELYRMKSEFILALDARELNMFKVLLDQRRFEMEFALDEQRFEMAKKEAEMELAWRKVNEIGYADNETAILLGIEPGTEAGWVKQMIAQAEYEMSIMAEKHKYDLENLALNKKIEMDLISERDRVNTESTLRLMETEYGFSLAKLYQKATQQAELKAIEDAKRAEAEAKAQREAEEKARLAAAEEIKKTKLDTEYKWAHNQFKYRFVTNSIVPEDMMAEASQWLYTKYSQGEISNPTYNKLISLYRLREYTPGISQQAYDFMSHANKDYKFVSEAEAEGLTALSRISGLNLKNRGLSIG